MATFGKRLRECREAKGLSQQELGKKMNTSYTVIGKYERDEMKPSIEVAAKLAKFIDTTVGYLLGEVVETDTCKDPIMLQRLKEINSLSDEEKKCVLFNLDAVLRDTKTRRAYQ